MCFKALFKVFTRQQKDLIPEKFSNSHNKTSYTRI